jgi:hypothetical protein
MNKELCDCGKTAVWSYMPGYSSGENPSHCDDCVPRGCTCNHRSTKEVYDNDPEGILNVDYKWIDESTWTSIDEKGREYPCAEYIYDEDGWDIDEE